MVELSREGSGRPLILLHPFPLSHRFWRPLRPIQGHEFIFPDFPGFGRSPLRSPFSFSLGAIQLRQKLHEMGIQPPFILGGISMGGYWALEFTRQFLGEVEKLALVSTRAAADKEEGKKKRLEMARTALEKGVEPLVQGFLSTLIGPTSRDTRPAVVETLSVLVREATPEGIALAQRTMADRRDQTALLEKISAKALVLAGVEDALIPVQESQTMAAALKNASLKIVPNAGHLLPLEAPEIFQSELESFLKS